MQKSRSLNGNIYDDKETYSLVYISNIIIIPTQTKQIILLIIPVNHWITTTIRQSWTVDASMGKYSDVN